MASISFPYQESCGVHLMRETLSITPEPQQSTHIAFVRFEFTARVFRDVGGKGGRAYAVCEARAKGTEEKPF